jgi:hypothetical protein
MDKEDAEANELLEQMKNPTLAESTFQDFARRVEVIRDLTQK